MTRRWKGKEQGQADPSPVKESKEHRMVIRVVLDRACLLEGHATTVGVYPKEVFLSPYAFLRLYSSETLV